MKSEKAGSEQGVPLVTSSEPLGRRNSLPPAHRMKSAKGRDRCAPVRRATHLFISSALLIAVTALLPGSSYISSAMLLRDDNRGASFRRWHRNDRCCVHLSAAAFERRLSARCLFFARQLPKARAHTPRRHRCSAQHRCNPLPLAAAGCRMRPPSRATSRQRH